MTKTPAGLKLGLSIMMFLQIFIWGAWFELNFGYVDKGLGLTGNQQWYIFSAFNIGALYALFFGTQFADRRFAAEKFLAFSHLIGGLAIGGLFFVAPAPDIRYSQWLFVAALTGFALHVVESVSARGHQRRE